MEIGLFVPKTDDRFFGTFKALRSAVDDVQLSRFTRVCGKDGKLTVPAEAKKVHPVTLANGYRTLAKAIARLGGTDARKILQLLNTVFTPVFVEHVKQNVRAIEVLPTPVLWFMIRYRQDLIGEIAKRRRHDQPSLAGLSSALSNLGVDVDKSKGRGGDRYMATLCFDAHLRNLERAVDVSGR